MGFDCTKCNAYCCRHVAVHIEKPRSKKDFDPIRWYLLHNNVWVSIDHEGDWLLEFKTDCKNISTKNKCKDYKNRPDICKNYPGEHEFCEGETEEKSYKYLFTNVSELDSYINSKVSERKRKHTKKISGVTK